MMLDKAAKEFEYDCKIRHLSPKTIDNYGKQLRYLQRFLEKEFSISSIEDVKPSHIKRFLAMMDDAGRKPQYERSLSGTKKAVVEAEQIEDIVDENDLYSEDFAYAEDYSESAMLDQAESDELAETDFISKLGQLLNQKKAQTKYTALNINTKLSSEQRKVLERVFDLITQEYDRESAEKFVNTISAKF